MKQGSTDDPFAETPDDEEPAADGTESEHTDAETSDDDSDSSERSARDPTGASAGGPTTGQQQSLPYIHARSGVKEGRTQRPVFLRDHVESGIDDLVAEMEAELGEDVYKTDVTEAAMAVAQEHPELVLAKLQDWGYGWS